MLPDIENGMVMQDDTSTVGSTANYTCVSELFTLTGDDTRQCQENGMWSGEQPSCVIVCPVLENITNGVVMQSGIMVGSTATYACAPEFMLIGNDTRQCQDDGMWSGEKPSCLIFCPVLENMPNGMVMQSGTMVGSTAIYACNSGYQIIGESIHQCQENGTWSDKEPSCLIICSVLESMTNGVVIQSGTTVGSTATYTCDCGYMIIGDDTRQCQENGMWSGEQPSCVIVCPVLENITNGVVTQNDTLVGSTATYTCDSGSVFFGNEMRVCQDDGTWSGPEPSCVPFEFIIVTCTSDLSMTIITINCKSNVALIQYRCQINDMDPFNCK